MSSASAPSAGPASSPRRIFELRPVQWLPARGCVVICAGGGGIPTMYGRGTRTLAADLPVIATDVDAVCLDRGSPQQRAVVTAHPDALDPGVFPDGSMGPKVEAAAQFARATERPAVIGSLDQLSTILAGVGGTRISKQAQRMETR